VVTAGSMAVPTACLKTKADYLLSQSPSDTTGAGDSFLAGFIHQLDQLGIHSLADPET